MQPTEKADQPTPEILRSLDELEHLVESSKNMPLTHHKIVDEDAFFVLTQRVKAAIPDVYALISAINNSPNTSSPAIAKQSLRLRCDDTVLLIVDIQERLMPAMHGAAEVEKNCLLLARAATQLKIPALITEQNPARLGSTPSELRALLWQSQPVSKMRFSACVPEIMNALQTSGRKTVLICGVEGHVCVLQTALDLLQAEYSVFAVRDAIASRTLENAQVGWDRMMQAGVLPTSTESAIFELLEEAGTPDFKALLPFLK